MFRLDETISMTHPDGVKIEFIPRKIERRADWLDIPLCIVGEHKATFPNHHSKVCECEVTFTIQDVDTMKEASRNRELSLQRDILQNSGRIEYLDDDEDSLACER